ncbi:chromatin-remodeling complex ATPase chain, partial [Raphidocelis subcapitata]
AGDADALAAATAPPGEDDPQPLTEEEVAEKERLLTEGFSSWNRRDFGAFVRACEKYGRDRLDQIAGELDTKSLDEVKAYAAAFWARYQELNDWEKVIKNIERGEQKIQRQADIMAALRAKIERYRNPWQDLKVAYGQAKGKAYNEEEDRFILCKTHELGYGAWDELKAAVRRHWRFRFDWFFKSRTPQELGRRCETLIRLIEKEMEDEGGPDAKRKALGRSASKGSLAESGGGEPVAVAKATAKRKAPGGGGGGAGGGGGGDGDDQPSKRSRATPSRLSGGD